MTEKRTKRRNVSDAINPDRAIFPISIVAEMLEVHQRTLRIYDEEEILAPSRSVKNRRLYSLNDIEKGRFIQYLTKELGINIVGVKFITTLLRELKIAPEKYIDYINKMALTLDITPEQQAENRSKLSKRGRKKTII